MINKDDSFSFIQESLTSDGKSTIAYSDGVAYYEYFGSYFCSDMTTEDFYTYMEDESSQKSGDTNRRCCTH